MFVDAPRGSHPGSPGLELSISWAEFESLVVRGPVAVRSCRLLSAAQGSALELELLPSGPWWFGRLWLASATARFSWSDGTAVTVESLLAGGRAWWEAWKETHATRDP